MLIENLLNKTSFLSWGIFIKMKMYTEMTPVHIMQHVKPDPAIIECLIIIGNII